MRTIDGMPGRWKASPQRRPTTACDRSESYERAEIASETPAGYDREHAGSSAASSPPGSVVGMTESVVEALDRAMTAVQQRAIDALTDQELLAELQSLGRVERRLAARTSRVIAAIGERESARARDAKGGGDDRVADRAAERARQQAEREVADRLNTSREEVRRAAQRGRQAGASPTGREAYDQGEIPARQASQLNETLGHIDDDRVRRDVEARLLEAAKTQNPKEFGRTCRELLATLDHDAATRAEDRRHARRKASRWQTPDGMTALHGEWAAVDGDIVATAINAFRRHDASGEHRTSGQRTADAVVAMASAALRAGEAPTQHGVRPHVHVTVAWQTILANAGVSYTSDGDPVPYAHIRRLLADCGVARLIVDAANAPVEAGIDVRTVPTGLHKLLINRDPTCAGDGCDVPHRFCDVMHLAVPFRFQGRLSPADSAFGCRFHHDKFDRGGWKATWIDGRPVVHHPDRPPRSSRSSPTGARVEGLPRAEEPPGAGTDDPHRVVEQISLGAAADARSP